jgi:hypothetical protein
MTGRIFVISSYESLTAAGTSVVCLPGELFLLPLPVRTVCRVMLWGIIAFPYAINAAAPRRR